jgi:hypothetical protein
MRQRRAWAPRTRVYVITWPGRLKLTRSATIVAVIAGLARNGTDTEFEFAETFPPETFVPVAVAADAIVPLTTRSDDFTVYW